MNGQMPAAQPPTTSFMFLSVSALPGTLWAPQNPFLDSAAFQPARGQEPQSYRDLFVSARHLPPRTKPIERYRALCELGSRAHNMRSRFGVADEYERWAFRKAAKLALRRGSPENAILPAFMRPEQGALQRQALLEYAKRGQPGVSRTEVYDRVMKTALWLGDLDTEWLQKEVLKKGMTPLAARLAFLIPDKTDPVGIYHTTCAEWIAKEEKAHALLNRALNEMPERDAGGMISLLKSVMWWAFNNEPFSSLRVLEGKWWYRFHPEKRRMAMFLDALPSLLSKVDAAANRDHYTADRKEMAANFFEQVGDTLADLERAKSSERRLDKDEKNQISFVLDRAYTRAAEMYEELGNQPLVARAKYKLAKYLAEQGHNLEKVAALADSLAASGAADEMAAHIYFLAARAARDHNEARVDALFRHAEAALGKLWHTIRMADQTKYNESRNEYTASLNRLSREIGAALSEAVGEPIDRLLAMPVSDGTLKDAEEWLGMKDPNRGSHPKHPTPLDPSTLPHKTLPKALHETLSGYKALIGREDIAADSVTAMILSRLMAQIVLRGEAFSLERTATFVDVLQRSKDPQLARALLRIETDLPHEMPHGLWLTHKPLPEFIAAALGETQDTPEAKTLKLAGDPDTYIIAGQLGLILVEHDYASHTQRMRAFLGKIADACIAHGGDFELIRAMSAVFGKMVNGYNEMTSGWVGSFRLMSLRAWSFDEDFNRLGHENFFRPLEEIASLLGTPETYSEGIAAAIKYARNPHVEV